MKTQYFKTSYGMLRNPFSYIGFWQMMTFFMLLLIVWVNELQDVSYILFGTARQSINIFRGCVLSAAVLATAVITVGNTYLQQRRVFRTLISVCARCHRVRLNDNTWILLEEYLSERLPLNFSHGFCPDCLAATMEEVKSNQANREKKPQHG